jgi:hypothetical protein
MKFIHQTDGSMNIIVDDVDNYECRDDMSVDVKLSPAQVRDLINSLNISYIVKILEAYRFYDKYPEYPPKSTIAKIRKNLFKW